MKDQKSPHFLLQQMAQIQRMERGKLCIIRQGADGPYFNHQTWENGKNTSRYVPRDQVEALEEALAGYQSFESLSKEYVQIMVEKTRAEREAGSKKKRPLRPSSSPKTRKSGG